MPTFRATFLVMPIRPVEALPAVRRVGDPDAEAVNGGIEQLGAGPSEAPSLKPWQRLRRRLRFPALALLPGLLVSLAACAPRSPVAAPLDRSDRPLVLTSFTVLADMAREVAGDRLRVESITKPGAEIHSYEPTPSDLLRGRGARLVLDNGMGLERWTDRYITTIGQVPRVTLSEGIQPLPVEDAVAPGAPVRRPNPHAWLSPRLALVYVENIRRAFVELDPGHRSDYDRRAAAYSARLRAEDLRLRAAVQRLPEQRRWIVSCEGAFSYLSRDYGLREASLWAVNGERQVTPRRMASVVATVRRHRIPAVFCESTVDDRAQQQVAKATGARFGGSLHVDSLSTAEGPAPTYLQLLRHNLDRLLKGLQSPATP